jgi:hypothetical protein
MAALQIRVTDTQWNLLSRAAQAEAQRQRAEKMNDVHAALAAEAELRRLRELYERQERS